MLILAFKRFHPTGYSHSPNVTPISPNGYSLVSWGKAHLQRRGLAESLAWPAVRWLDATRLLTGRPAPPAASPVQSCRKCVA